MLAASANEGLGMTSNTGSTLGAVLRSWAARIPEDRACTFLANGDDEHSHLTYRDLDHRGRAIASAIQRSTPSGSRTLLLYPQGLDYLTAFVGCLYAGVVAVPFVTPRAKQSLARVESVVRDSGAVLALGTRAWI